MKPSPHLYWIPADKHWETEDQLIARLRQSPRGLTLYQLALAAGISKADRSPIAFMALLKKHHILWVQEANSHTASVVPENFWKFDAQRFHDEATEARQKIIKEVKAHMLKGKDTIYRGCSGD